MLQSEQNNNDRFRRISLPVKLFHTSHDEGRGQTRAKLINETAPIGLRSAQKPAPNLRRHSTSVRSHFSPMQTLSLEGRTTSDELDLKERLLSTHAV